MKQQKNEFPPHVYSCPFTADELYATRQDFGLTQDRMARALGVTASTFYKWEAGRNNIPISIGVLVRMMRTRRAIFKLVMDMTV